MTIDEAIRHAEEKAKEQRDNAVLYDTHPALKEKVNTYLACAEEHEQLAEWLKELKELREAMEMIKKRYILVEKSPRDNPSDLMIGKVEEKELKWCRECVYMTIDDPEHMTGYCKNRLKLYCDTRIPCNDFKRR